MGKIAEAEAVADDYKAAHRALRKADLVNTGTDSVLIFPGWE